MRQFDRSASERSARDVSLAASLLVFWCVGPATGHLASVFISAGMGFHPPGVTYLGTLQGWALLSPIILPIIWILGTVPAVVTAVAYWAFPPALRASGIAAILVSGMVGAVACAGTAVALTGRVSVLSEASKLIAYVVPGAVGGFISAFTMEWCRRRWNDVDVD